MCKGQGKLGRSMRGAHKSDVKEERRGQLECLLAFSVVEAGGEGTGGR
jgi:hypothetical protein